MLNDLQKMAIIMFAWGVVLAFMVCFFWLEALDHRVSDLSKRVAVVEQFLALGDI